MAMTPGQAAEQLTFADEMLSSLVEQLQSPSTRNQPCATTLRQVTEKLQAAKDGFSAADQEAVRQFVPFIRTRSAQVEKLLESAAAFYQNALRMNSTGIESYTPDGFLSCSPSGKSLDLEA